MKESRKFHMNKSCSSLHRPSITSASTLYAAALNSIFLIYPPRTPPNLQHPRPDKTYKSRSITSAHELNQDIIIPSPRRQKLSRNRYTGQAAEAHDGIQPGIPPSKHLGLAQLSHADGRKTDVAPRREAEEDAEDDQLGDTARAVFR